MQLIKRKSLLRVDNSILVLGCFYLLVMAAYLFFEYNIVNYRPVLIRNVLETNKLKGGRVAAMMEKIHLTRYGEIHYWINDNQSCE